MSFDIEEQYDKIYRYCWFRLKNRETAEDITQEAFLRYFEHYDRMSGAAALKYLYTIARNLCTDEYRKAKTEPMGEALADSETEERLVTSLAVRAALQKLAPDEQELLLLRYVNEVPISVIGRIYGISRFAVYRRLKGASEKFRAELREEKQHE